MLYKGSNAINNASRVLVLNLTILVYNKSSFIIRILWNRILIIETNKKLNKQLRY